MTTSGTATTELNVNEIVEEAYERCGKELRTGYDLRTAVRSLNIMFMDWANRGVNLWTVDSGTVALVDGTATYNLPVDTVDLLQQVIRTGSGSTQADYNIERISNATYSTIPNKNIEGRPTQVWIDRQHGTTDPSAGVRYPTITLWPVPSSSDYTFVYWRLRRIQDAGTGVTTQDVPFRFVPVLIAGLAYHLSMKSPDVGSDRVALLKVDYNEQWRLAADEDREKETLRIVPRAYR